MRRMVLKKTRLARRQVRVRKRVIGSAKRPRLAVSRSIQNVYAQIIDDVSGRTLCALSTQSKDVKSRSPYGGNCKAAAVVGEMIGEKARALGIEAVCFDRRGRMYHGRIKALADAARKAGLKF